MVPVEQSRGGSYSICPPVQNAAKPIRISSQTNQRQQEAETNPDHYGAEDIKVNSRRNHLGHAHHSRAIDNGVGRCEHEEHECQAGSQRRANGRRDRTHVGPDAKRHDHGQGQLLPPSLPQGDPPRIPMGLATGPQPMIPLRRWPARPPVISPRTTLGFSSRSIEESWRHQMVRGNRMTAAVGDPGIPKVIVGMTVAVHVTALPG